MSSWADVAAGAAGFLISVLGALQPRVIAVAEHWLDTDSEPKPETPASSADHQ